MRGSGEQRFCESLSIGWKRAWESRPKMAITASTPRLLESREPRLDAHAHDTLVGHRGS